MNKEELKAKIIEYRFQPIKEELFDFFTQYEALCDPKQDRLDLSILYFYMGEAYFRLGNYEKTVSNMNKSLLVEKPEDKKDFDASAYNILGLMFTFTGYEVIAIENYLSALSIAKKYHLHNQAAVIHVNMGWLYRDLNSLDRAMENYDAALKELHISRDANYYNIEILTQAYRGQIFCKTGQFQKALKVKDTIEELRMKNHVVFYDVSVENFYIRIYDHLNQPDMVQKYISSFLKKVSCPDNFLEFCEFYVDVCKFTMEKGMKEASRLLLDALHKNAATIDMEFIRLQIQGLEVQYQQKYSSYESYLDACRVYMVIQRHYENALKKAKLLSIDLIHSLNKTQQEKAHFEELSRRDSMTQLYNKNTIEFIIKEFLDQQPSQNAALILMDIDYFKNVNDSFGHLTGDYVITAVASLVNEYFQQNGSAGRFGGDEFLILVKNSTQKELIKNLEKLRHEVSQIRLGPDKDYSITISCGVLFLSKKQRTYEESFSLVDQALYEAKGNGKDKIVIAKK